MKYTAERVERFKTESSTFLQTISVKELQAYGRMLQLREPTKMRKKELIEDIIKVHCGELLPEERSKQGAPIRNGLINPLIVEKMREYREKILDAKECELEIIKEPKREIIEKKKTKIKQLPAKEKHAETKKTSPVTLKLEIQPSVLTKEQRKLFNAFINSL